MRHPGEWLAIYKAHNWTQFSPCESRGEAEGHITLCEDGGTCYGVAIYHIPTDTLHMYPHREDIDPEKVRDEIRRYLERGNRGL